MVNLFLNGAWLVLLLQLGQHRLLPWEKEVPFESRVKGYEFLHELVYRPEIRARFKVPDSAHQELFDQSSAIVDLERIERDDRSNQILRKYIDDAAFEKRRISQIRRLAPYPLDIVMNKESRSHLELMPVSGDIEASIREERNRIEESRRRKLLEVIRRVSDFAPDNGDEVMRRYFGETIGEGDWSREWDGEWGFFSMRSSTISARAHASYLARYLPPKEKGSFHYEQVTSLLKDEFGKSTPAVEFEKRLSRVIEPSIRRELLQKAQFNSVMEDFTNLASDKVSKDLGMSEDVAERWKEFLVEQSRDAYKMRAADELRRMQSILPKLPPADQKKIHEFYKDVWEL